MEPIIDMHRKIMVQENLENVFKKLENFSLQLTNEESKLRNKGNEIILIYFLRPSDI
jgi:hypothetical protein